MKHIIATIVILVSSTLAFAANGQFDITPEYLKQIDYAYSHVMACNWDKNLDNLQIFGYYGKDGVFQDVVAPERASFGGTLLLKFAPSVGTHTQGGELHHISVEFGQTNQKCSAGFGFGQVGGGR